MTPTAVVEWKLAGSYGSVGDCFENPGPSSDTSISMTGLTEFANEVLSLEAHARRTEPKVFGSAPKATRFK